MELTAFLRARCERTAPNVVVGMVSAPGVRINGSQPMTEHPTLWSNCKPAAAYYWRCIKMACDNSRAFVGTNWTGAIFGLGVLVIGLLFTVSSQEKTAGQAAIDFLLKGGGIMTFVVLVVAAFLAPLKIHLDDQKTISDFRGSSPQQLKLVHNKLDAQHVFDVIDGRFLFRIGVQNLEKTNAKGVAVFIKSMTAHGRDKRENGRLADLFVDAPLLRQHRRMNDRLDSPVVDIRGLRHQNYDLVELVSFGSDQVSICHSLIENPPALSLPRGCYRIRLIATAENCHSAEADFWIGCNQLNPLIVKHCKLKHSGS